MGQMPSMSQIHRQNLVPMLQKSEIHCRVGLRPRMRLDIRMFRPKQLLGPIDRCLLHIIHKLTSAIPATPGITLRILVR